VVRGTRWPITPHTQAKHLILKRHLDAWLPIMTQGNAQLRFIDGFAGPGRYEGGEDGSPIIALKAAVLNRRFQTAPPQCAVQFVFVEEDGDRVAALRQEIATFVEANPLPHWVTYDVQHAEFSVYLTADLDRATRQRARLPSTFAFIDPFGYSDVPMSLITRIRHIPSSECLINFAYKSMNRWAAGDPTRERHLDQLFGTPTWRQSWGDEHSLVQLYRQQLASQAGFRHVRTFQMRGNLDVTEYFLAFCTGSAKGLSVFKRATWKADPATGQIFSDASDPNQLLLLNPLPALRDLLLVRFSSRGWVGIDQVAEYVLVETDYSEAIHLKQRTLGPMEGEGAAVLQVRRPSGKRNRRGEYPDGTQLKFGGG
jgi:three-Cys-motif partner protein